MVDLKTIVARAKRKGFVFPGSEIYGGLANSRDFGPYGALLKKNIADLWRNFFIKQRDDIIGLDSSILMNPKVWQTSGHLENFNDPMIDDKITKERFRADKLIEDKIQQDLNNFYTANTSGISATKEISSGNKQYNEALKQAEEAVLKKYQQEIGDEIKNLYPESRSYETMEKFIKTYIPNNPNTGNKADRTNVRKFNLMFKTFQGIIEDEANAIYLRPETAQGIFVNFKNILDTTRMRLPFGIGQIGKAFRNEITPGNFLYRLREFEQMEIEYFVNPEEDEKYFQMWKELSYKRRTEIIGIKKENLRFRDHEKEELSHYSKATTDVEFKYPRGRGELQGIANRTDFDLRQHMKASGVDMQYSDPKTGKRFVPYVIEPSRGLTRATLAVMMDAYNEEKYTDANGNEAERVVMKFKFEVAPIKFAILPLIKKDEEQIKIAKDIFKNLSKKYYCEYDENGAIGKRYRRQDEIGTPYCITIDYQSKEDGTITIRNRDTMEQKRIKIDEIEKEIN